MLIFTLCILTTKNRVCCWYLPATRNGYLKWFKSLEKTIKFPHILFTLWFKLYSLRKKQCSWTQLKDHEYPTPFEGFRIIIMLELCTSVWICSAAEHNWLSTVNAGWLVPSKSGPKYWWRNLSATTKTSLKQNSFQGFSLLMDKTI